MEKDKKIAILKKVAQIFQDHQEKIKENWFNFLYQRKFIDSEDELRYLGATFEQLLEDFISLLSHGDIEGYFKKNKIIATTIAYNDISFAKFVTVFQIFEDSYLGVLMGQITDEDELPEAIEAINELHQQTISCFAEIYFSIHYDTIRSFAKLSTLRDIETPNHLERTRQYAVCLARELEITPDDVASIDLVAPLHDLGKLSLPDSVLNQFPEEIAGKEKEIFQTHVTVGAEVINDILGKQTPSRGFLKIAKGIILSHHENYDGSGYPSGLKGDDIPIVARIFALADVYDCITCKKTVKAPLSHKEALEYIKERSGLLFDSKVVDAFLNVESEFKKIHEELAD